VHTITRDPVGSKTTLDACMQTTCFERWWWRSAGPIVRDTKYYKESRRRETTYKQQKEGRLTGWSYLVYKLPFKISHGRIERRIKVMWRRGRRRKQLLVKLKDKRGYWKVRRSTRSHSAERTRFGSELTSCRTRTERHTYEYIVTNTATKAFFFVCAIRSLRRFNHNYV
jgi:hypothetical protein